MKLVFATHNINKLNEVKLMLPIELELFSLDQVGCTEDIAETEPTLEGNAMLKARYIKKKYGCNCFSDDTGLEVEALGGRPGVLSARYAGDKKNSDDNIAKLLSELNGITNRKARFRTVIALIIGSQELLFEGIAEGEIIWEKKGKDGFGYDPVFLPVGYDKTFAEMPLALKNSISHRYKSFRMLADYLVSYNYI